MASFRHSKVDQEGEHHSRYFVEDQLWLPLDIVKLTRRENTTADIL